jgi:hypothetical protein
MSQKLLLAAVTIWGTVSLTHPAFSETFLAVGLPQGGPLHGWVYGYAKTAAEALNMCRGVEVGTNNNNGIADIPSSASEAQQACKTVGDLNNQCFAIASNGTATIAASALGWIISKDEGTAKAQAMTECNGMRSGDASQCVLRYSYCDVTK